jgi:hypothetical protein
VGVFGEQSRLFGIGVLVVSHSADDFAGAADADPRGDDHMTILLDAGVAIYVAMATALIVWVGVFLFLLRIDHATQDVARQLNERTTATDAPLPRATIISNDSATQ